MCVNIPASHLQAIDCRFLFARQIFVCKMCAVHINKNRHTSVLTINRTINKLFPFAERQRKRELLYCYSYRIYRISSAPLGPANNQSIVCQFSAISFYFYLFYRLHSLLLLLLFLYSVFFFSFKFLNKVLFSFVLLKL